MLPKIFTVGFHSNWFNTTFPVSALASLLLLHHKYYRHNTGWVFAVIALAIASVWNLVVLVCAYASAFTGHMFIANPKPAPGLIPGVASKLINSLVASVFLALLLAMTAVLLYATW